ncbi:MAG: isoleucine--tRNA ligase [Patescibacteria group bacterium]|nr:isoleucine--tRNA ligase [Patescibacteria group bacterium]
MDFIENEHNILKFWRENKIFEKLREKNKGKKPWSFLDGPITANNPMGVHHAWGRTYKDVFQRYKAMRGFDGRFQNGFDCQGLWVEVEVEKELGFKNKKDIEKYGIEKFVKKCKERVKKFSKVQTLQSIRLGQWMDWQNSYFTMSDENNYAIWHFLKKCHQKKLLYKGRDVVPWCPRCGTAISQHEILSEEYQEIVHKAIYIKFQIQNSKTYFLVWTTTPWTLPGNVALAVQPELLYAKVKDKEGNIIILLKDKSNLIEEGKIIETFKGKKLEGLEYQGLFDELPAVKKSLGNYQHSVILWKEVSQEEGTGIVHIAPGCGEEDYQLSKEFNLPVIDPTDNESRYKENFGNLKGKFVFEDKTRDLIFENLTKKDRVFELEDYKHRYPICWRCKQELIFRLVDEWYIAMEPLRKPLMKIVYKINWIPSFGKERELDWLKNMKDWLISKKRYWGLALPIFECQKCGNFEVIGSKKELQEKAVEGWGDFEGHSPHRPWIDKIKIKCPKCGRVVSRVPDVGNPWLDAGIVPFSTMGYFENKKFWQKWFPADFICESFPGQFKNWFYSLLVMSYVLEETNPFKTVFGYASVVDEKGEEMHKSKGNVIWFETAVEKMGADVMRWLYVRQNPVYNLRFGWKIAQEVKRKLLTLWNSYNFFETYTENPKSKVQMSPFISGQIQNLKSKNLLDKWIVSRMNGLIEKVTKALDNYDVARASLAIEDFFINDLSLWYIRRSRKRFQMPKNKKEKPAFGLPPPAFGLRRTSRASAAKQEAEETLFYVLLTLAKLIAPMLPFFAEEVYQSLRSKSKIKNSRFCRGSSMPISSASGQKSKIISPLSVHLCNWPESDKSFINEKLEKEMVQVREIVAKVLAKRTELGIKVRQPLKKLKVKSEKLKVDKKLLELIKDEVNVKEIVFDPKIKEEIELDTKITKELKEEGYIREIIRQVQDLRKKAGLTPRDKIELKYFTESKNLANLISKFQEEIKLETRSLSLTQIPKKEEKFSAQKEVKIDSHTIDIYI